MSDICFIIAPQNKDTILDRIAHEIGAGFKTPLYHYQTTDVPKAERYFVTHYSLLPGLLAQVNPSTNPVVVFFTHNKGNLAIYVDLFNMCHAVVAENPEGVQLLNALGVNPKILYFVPEGGDNLVFRPHTRTQEGAILICGTNYADGRKNFDLINKVCEISGLNHKFVFLGNNWIESEFSDLPYSRYPEVFSKCSVYLSCSKLEGGGPNSLIEAMHANLVPVVSDTGNAREYIVDGYNGFIFNKDATPEQVATLIEKAYQLEPQNSIPYNDVWQTVRSFTWDNYSIQMREIIFNDYAFTNSQELPDDDDNDSFN